MPYNIVDILSNEVKITPSSSCIQTQQTNNRSYHHLHNTAPALGSCDVIANCVRSYLAADFSRELAQEVNVLFWSDLISKRHSSSSTQNCASFVCPLSPVAEVDAAVPMKSRDQRSESSRLNCTETNRDLLVTPLIVDKSLGMAMAPMISATPWRPFLDEGRHETKRILSKPSVANEIISQVVSDVVEQGTGTKHRTNVDAQPKGRGGNIGLHSSRADSINIDKQSTRAGIITIDHEQQIVKEQKKLKTHHVKRSGMPESRCSGKLQQLLHHQHGVTEHEEINVNNCYSKNNNAYSQSVQQQQHYASTSLKMEYTTWRHSLPPSEGSPVSSHSSPSPGRRVTALHKGSPDSTVTQSTTAAAAAMSCASLSSNGFSSRHSVGPLTSMTTKMTSSAVSMPLTCSYCDKVYTSVGALKMHVRTHTLPCRCPHCGKAFSRLWLLRGHMRTHTGERPFHCPDPGCHRAFADRSNLRAHQRTHAGGNCRATGSGTKRYECTTCAKTFTRMSLLSRHEATTGCRSKDIVNDESSSFAKLSVRLVSSYDTMERKS